MRESSARSDEKLPAREVDRRQWVRYPVRLAATCRAGGSVDEPVWSAQVQDISHGGLRLMCPHSMDLETTVLISPSYPRLLPRLARVVCVRDRPDGNWMVGCAFTREPIDERELLRWVQYQNGKA